ncbi:MAG: ribosome silencing factor [Clostridia bacterium]|nr:ribosome silencing factor [Clostridia bacterium]
MNTPRKIAAVAVKALDDKLGEGIKVLDVGEISSLADYFVICTGTTNTHIKSLCDAVDVKIGELGEPMIHREGHRSGTWVLMDFGCVVVHVFTDETRKFYDLERLWNDSKPIDLEALLAETEEK